MSNGQNTQEIYEQIDKNLAHLIEEVQQLVGKHTASEPPDFYSTVQ